jgi:Putative metallopeptidase
MLNRVFWICALGSILLSGPYPAMAQPGQPEAGDQVKERLKAGSEQFRARLDEAARAMENIPRLKSLSQQQRKDVVEFVAGNMLFVLTHELGHALIGEMDLYVLGREEDAADAFAVTAMLEVGTEVSARVLVQAATGWFLSDKRNQAEGIELNFYDDHGLDRQRAYQIVCLMVGSDANKFAEAADKAKLPKSRQQTCEDDYGIASSSWSTALKPHLRGADQPKQKIDVVYGPAKGPVEVIAQAFRTIKLLETVANLAAERYAWPRPITLEMLSCGQPNAHWDLDGHKIVICYELGQDFAMLFRDFGMTTAKEPKKR